ncbi:MAG: response regulator [Anaerolineae bacterium]
MIVLKDNFLQGYTVLVVDDEPDGVRIVELLLKRYGASVLSASNGRAGLEVACERRPHLIVSDLSMPKLDGWKMMEALKTHELTRDIPTIALTGHSISDEQVRLKAAGFHGCLAKPLRPLTFVHDLMALLVDLPQFASLVEREA